MIEKLTHLSAHRVLVGAGVAVLALAAVVGTFASQEEVQIQEEPTVEASPTPTDTATSEPTEEPTATPTDVAEPTEEPTDVPDATETPGPTETPDDDDVHGIPEEHPVFTPDDDGECEKHESAIKTTPSGTMVRVPCHAADKKHDGEEDVDSPDEESDDNATDGESTEEHEETPDDEPAAEED
jgi:glucose/arabinose dehydrogenase